MPAFFILMAVPIGTRTPLLLACSHRSSGHFLLARSAHSISAACSSYSVGTGGFGAVRRNVAGLRVMPPPALPLSCAHSWPPCAQPYTRDIHFGTAPLARP